MILIIIYNLCREEVATFENVNTATNKALKRTNPEIIFYSLKGHLHFRVKYLFSNQEKRVTFKDVTIYSFMQRTVIKHYWYYSLINCIQHVYSQQTAEGKVLYLGKLLPLHKFTSNINVLLLDMLIIITTFVWI